MDYFNFSINSFLKDLHYLERTFKFLARTMEYHARLNPESMTFSINERLMVNTTRHLAHCGRLTLESLEK